VRDEKMNISIKKFELVLNRGIILSMLVVTGFSIVLSGCLAYFLFDSFYAMVSGLVFSVTLGALLNYFLLISDRVIQKINADISFDDEECLQTFMRYK